MSDSQPNSRPPLTDSPWFWVYVFGTAGLISLVWISPKFGERQSQLHRQFQGRQHATELPADVDARNEFATADDRERSLAPLYAVLAVALVIGWIGLWYQRYRRLGPGPEVPASGRHGPSGPTEK